MIMKNFLMLGLILNNVVSIHAEGDLNAGSTVDTEPSANADSISYSIYNPTITTHTILDPLNSFLNYNHSASMAFFDNHWIAVWNANTVHAEAQVGQAIYMSTSVDGEEWTEAEDAFVSGKRSETAIPCNHTQWQPVLINHDDELWCFWSQFSHSNPNRTETDETYGVYISTLHSFDGKWQNRRLLWDGNPDPFFDGKHWRVLPMQNPVRLTTGRYLVPVIMIGPKLANAPVHSVVWPAEKRVSVIYSDDDGVTWHYSEGITMEEEEDRWAPWEPTVWERADGTLSMFFRSNDSRDAEEGGAEDWGVLLHAESVDGGVTWTNLETVPIQTVISRMHVMRQEQDALAPISPEERYLMVHNSSQHKVPRVTRDRNSITLFVNRGGSQDFVSGINLSDRRTVVSYPHMAFKDDDLYVCYTRGTGHSEILVTKVSPLPDPDRYYVYPRTPPYPDMAKPELFDDHIHFHGGQYVDLKEKFTADDSGVLHFGTRYYMELGGTLFDLKGPSGQRGPRFEIQRGRLTVSIPGLPRIDAPNEPLPVEHLHGWMSMYMYYYLGVTIDMVKGTADFYVNGTHIGSVPFTPGKALESGEWSLRAGANWTTPDGRPRGVIGDLKMAAVWQGEKGEETHQLLYESAEETEAAMVPNGVVLDMRDSEWMDQIVIPPSTRFGTVDISSEEGDEIFTVYGAAGAGVELPAWDPEKGERIEGRMRFKVLEEKPVTVLTFGDLKQHLELRREGFAWIVRQGEKEYTWDCDCDSNDWVDVNFSFGLTDFVLRCKGTEEPLTVPISSDLKMLWLSKGFLGAEATERGSISFDVGSLKMTLKGLDKNRE